MVENSELMGRILLRKTAQGDFEVGIPTGTFYEKIEGKRVRMLSVRMQGNEIKSAYKENVSEAAILNQIMGWRVMATCDAVGLLDFVIEYLYSQHRMIHPTHCAAGLENLFEDLSDINGLGVHAFTLIEDITGDKPVKAVPVKCSCQDDKS